MKSKFNKVIDFFKEKIIGFFGKETKDKYNSIATDLYINDKIDEETYNKMLNSNIKNKDDDFEL